VGVVEKLLQIGKLLSEQLKMFNIGSFVSS